MATMRITSVFTGGIDRYEEKQTKNRKKTSVPENLERPAGEERAAFSKTELMHKIVAALAINVWFFGRVCLFL
jgi:hypothetical protein